MNLTILAIFAPLFAKKDNIIAFAKEAKLFYTMLPIFVEPTSHQKSSHLGYGVAGQGGGVTK